MLQLPGKWGSEWFESLGRNQETLRANPACVLGPPTRGHAVILLSGYNAFAVPRGMLTGLGDADQQVEDPDALAGRTVGGHWNRWDTLEPMEVPRPRGWYEKI